MFLIRSAILLALLIAILPSDPAGQARLQATASHALHQAVTFCDRNKDVCDQAGVYWTQFKDKAAVGARMAGELVNEHWKRQQSVHDAPAVPRFDQPLPVRDTLSAADRSPDWRLKQPAALR